MRVIAAFAVLLFSLLPATAQPAVPMPVVASFSVIADFLKVIGGDRVQIETLVPPGGDAHVFAPSPQDARKLGAARLVFVNGLKFEGWIDRLVKSSGTKATIITVTKGIKPLMETERGSPESDPHAWHAVPNAKIYVTNIRDGLIAANPDGREAYAAAAKSYLEKLDALDAEVRQALAAIPQERRRIITTHDALGYLAATYGLTVMAPLGISTDSEPSAQDVAKIIRQIRQDKMPAVFLENVSDPRLIQRIAAESGAKVGGTLYSDGLSPADGPAGTYIDMVRHNIRELTAALAR